ncbi:MAG: hypothetical protein J5928_05685 [Firmicutes bacterium]|nr:hypothetical protein [Bacillota bacterium]
MGSEMIEAAIILPLLLLAVVSIISLSLYCYGAFKNQLAVQKVLLFEAIDKRNVFSVLSEGSEVSRTSEGLFTGVFHREYRQRLYVINEELVLRAGEVIGSAKDD